MITRQDYFNAAEFLYWLAFFLRCGTSGMTAHVGRGVFTFRWKEWKEIGVPTYFTEVDIRAGSLCAGNIRDMAFSEAKKIRLEIESDRLDKLPIRHSPPAITSS